MWGIDDNAAFAARANLQYIELYNTVADADAEAATDDKGISVANWRLFFFSDHSTATGGYLDTLNDDGMLEVDFGVDGADADGEIAENGSETFIVVDIVSNISKGGYTFDVGQSGALRPAATVEGVAPKDIISAYRNINYTNVVKTDIKPAAVDNRKAAAEGCSEW